MTKKLKKLSQFLSPAALAARAAFRNTARGGAVMFDVDSTVSTEEGIDVLAAALGKGEAVAEWTRKAMGGSVPFEVALAARLDLIKPTRSSLDSLIASHPFPVTPGIPELINLLRSRGTKVYFVSGGFIPLIMPVARKCGVPREDIFAIDLLFNSDGSFKSHDPSAPTSRSGGKTIVAAKLKDLHKGFPVVVVGDGATDIEARPPADAAIGFGANVVREAVKAKADWFVTDVKDLIQALQD